MSLIFGDTSAIDALNDALAIIILANTDQIGSKIYNLAIMYNDNAIFTRSDYLVIDFVKKTTLP